MCDWRRKRFFVWSNTSLNILNFLSRKSGLPCVSSSSGHPIQTSYILFLPVFVLQCLHEISLLFVYINAGLTGWLADSACGFLTLKQTNNKNSLWLGKHDTRTINEQRDPPLSGFFPSSVKFMLLSPTLPPSICGFEWGPQSPLHVKINDEPENIKWLLKREKYHKTCQGFSCFYVKHRPLHDKTLTPIPTTVCTHKPKTYNPFRACYPSPF